MQVVKLSPNNIRFDAAMGNFEALVTIIDAGKTHRYPCACTGHVSMPLSIAAQILSKQAVERHRSRDDLRSVAMVDAAQRAALESHTLQLPQVA